MAQKLIFLETSDIGARYSAQAARHLGFEPIFLVQMKNYQADTRAQLREEKTIDCDTNQVESILETLHAKNVHDIAGVMTFLDSRLSPSLQVASHLGVPGLDPAIRHLKDKGSVARLIPEFSPPTMNFHRDEIPFNQIGQMLADYGRIVLKPTRTAGGIGNFTISSENFDRIEKLIREVSLPSALDQGHWVAQAFCEGPLVSAEGYVRDGNLCILGFSDRRKIGLTESQINFPTDDKLNEVHHNQCVAALTQLIQRSGFRRGYFHVEFILHPQGAVVIDANVGRLGGGSVGEQIADSFSLDPIDVFTHVIVNSIFPERIGPDPYSKTRTPTLGILYGVRAQGKFEALTLPATLRARHTQILDAGQLIPQMGISNWSWVGILSGHTHEVESAIREIQICNNGKWQTPCY